MQETTSHKNIELEESYKHQGVSCDLCKKFVPTYIDVFGATLVCDKCNFAFTMGRLKAPTSTFKPIQIVLVIEMIT